ncbi:MAG: lipopolysaccharide transport periplasmic protein LptA [Amphritea sp.]
MLTSFLPRTFSLLLALTLSSATLALPTDKSKPIHISADSATRNDLTGITIYKGRVKVSQGSMHISGDIVELHQNADGVSVILANGAPAHYQQRPEAEQEITHAFGKKLNYDTRTQELTITGQAKVTQGGDTFSGDRIIYDMKQSTVDAFSDSNIEGSRVQMVIQPKKEADKAAQQEQSQ